eukprot:5461226-Pyramimonas_sp.AAC.1
MCRNQHTTEDVEEPGGGQGGEGSREVREEERRTLAATHVPRYPPGVSLNHIRKRVPTTSARLNSTDHGRRVLNERDSESIGQQLDVRVTHTQRPSCRRMANEKRTARNITRVRALW